MMIKNTIIERPYVPTTIQINSTAIKGSYGRQYDE